MEARTRPWFATGVALVGAGAIAISPVAPPPAAERMAATVAAPLRTLATDVRLTAGEIPYILTLPVLRQSIQNWIDDWAVYLNATVQTGTGIAESLASIPAVATAVVQNVTSGNLVGAFTTLTTAVRDAVVAIGYPLTEALIWSTTRTYAIQAATYAAAPVATFNVVNGFLQAGGTVAASLIQSVQNVVGAVFSGSFDNVVAAVTDGVRSFVAALGAGAQSVVAGIEAAQRLMVSALSVLPPPVAPPITISSVPASVPALAVSLPSVTTDVSDGAHVASRSAVAPDAPADATVGADVADVMRVSEAPVKEAYVPEATVEESVAEQRVTEERDTEATPATDEPAAEPAKDPTAEAAPVKDEKTDTAEPSTSPVGSTPSPQGTTGTSATNAGASTSGAAGTGKDAGTGDSAAKDSGAKDSDSKGADE